MSPAFVPFEPAAAKQSGEERLGKMRALSFSGVGQSGSIAPTESRFPGADDFASWRSHVRRAVLGYVADFVDGRRTGELGGARIDVVGDILEEFVAGGKCLRSTFTYLGWLCGGVPSESALRAAASFELLHAFALLQDDVMDGSTERRGRPAAHLQFARWHRESGLSGSSRRFGESSAILLGDLCLIWAEQMLRESGVEIGRAHV